MGSTSKCVFSLCTLIFCFSIARAQGNIFSVSKYGAVSDGKTDNSEAFSSAWQAACGASEGVLSVPPGTYFLSGASFQGPCNGRTHFQNQGYVVASSGSNGKEYWISFEQIDGLHIYGQGTFDGNGASAWALKKKSCSGSCGSLPTSIKIVKVTNLAIEGITSLNSKQFHFKIGQSQGVVVSNVKIQAPAKSPNTDGIHVSKSKSVKILSSSISTGDDCISIGDGCEDIHIESITCGPGHGISIGSLGKYPDEEDVTGVYVKNCNLTNTSNGLRIKTWAPSSVSTRVYNVTFENINVRDVKNPIIINQYYCPKSGCSHSGESRIKIDLVKFKNVTGTSVTPVAVLLQCSKSVPCQNLEFEGLSLTTAGGKSTTAACSSAKCKFNDANENPRTCGEAPSLADAKVIAS